MPSRAVQIALGAVALIVTSLSMADLTPAAAATRRTVVPARTSQLIVGLVPNWNSRDVVLHRFARKGRGSWVEDRTPWSGRLGSRGVAWGRGIHPHEPIPAGATDKVEGDHRSPAGVFELGTVFGFATSVPHRPSVTYVQVTDHDLLVEDPASPMYNTYVRLDHAAASPWEVANQMTTVDPAHELKVFVRHNTTPAPVPGKGSAILLHIVRPADGAYTAGCTAMARADLFDTVAWLDSDRHPLYVLLPQSEYDRVARSWGLPTQLVSSSPTRSPSTTTGPN